MKRTYHDETFQTRGTLLMQAAVYATPVDLGFLLAHGADVNAANKADHTALMRAMAGLAKIKLLVEHGANVNAITSGGNTPLLLAAHIRTAEDVVRRWRTNASVLTKRARISRDCETRTLKGQMGSRRKLTGLPPILSREQALPHYWPVSASPAARC